MKFLDKRHRKARIMSIDGGPNGMGFFDVRACAECNDGTRVSFRIGHDARDIWLAFTQKKDVDVVFDVEHDGDGIGEAFLCSAKVRP